MRKLACVLCVAVCACSSGSGTQQEAAADEYIVDCTGTDAGSGVTSDENLAAFINAEASNKVVINDPCSPELTSPAAGQTLSAQTPRLISFTDTHSSCPTAPIPPRTGLRKVPRQQPGYSRVIEALLARVVSSDAQAHCGAITGINYYFKVLPQGGTTPLYTAMLSVTSFTPDAAKWQKAMAGRNGQTVTIVIERANFLKGDILGSVLAMQASFTVGP
jgi:hypothetical protein